MTPAGRGWVLRGRAADGEQRFRLASGVQRIGSDPAHEVCLPVHGVSRLHARLVVRAAGALLEDLASKNGTFVNGERIESRRVGAGDRLGFGAAELIFEPASAGDDTLAIAWSGFTPPAASPVGTRPMAGGETSVLLPKGVELPPGFALPEGYVAGPSAAMAALHRTLATVAPSRLTVLVVGETGVGKEWMARLLHGWSGRQGRLVPLNCAALPKDLLEAELFGVERGAATGVEARPGLFRRADGGTLFLDEVGELPLPLQAKLLRVLQDGEVRPLGGKVRHVDTRLVAATNVSLDDHLAEGRLRSDLYYRLAGCTLKVPPLRHRREDIPALVEFLTKRLAVDLGRRPRGVTVGALERLTSYRWPGNVRELEHQLHRLVIACPAGQAIDSTLLDSRIRSSAAEADPSEPSASGDGDLSLRPRVDALETRLITEALARTGGNRTRAAELLGITRNGLSLKIDRLGLRDSPST